MNLSREDFIKKYNGGKSFFFFETIPSDLYTPVLTLKKLAKLSPYHCLFESVTGGEKRGRYSIIALDPDLIWICENNSAKLSKDIGHFENLGSNEKIFESLRKIQKESKIEKTEELPSMAAGLFGYMGYDMVRLMEKLPDKNKNFIDIPDSVFFRPRVVIVFDNIKDRLFVITPIYINKNQRADAAYKEASEKLGKVINIIKNSDFDDDEEIKSKQNKIELKSHIDKEKYCQIVEKAKEYIKAGDIFQIVPSRRFSGNFKLPPIAFYRSLRSLNPSPYLFYLSLNGFNIIGSSPEILVKLKDGKVTVRPIAGTRKRGENEEQDLALEKDLLSDQKEIAEHLMLLDLGRNDVGRVVDAGTVKVTDKMIVERYSHVMHIVSNVEGKIAKGKRALDALIAGFPAGTVTGAPKVRAMEIIEELEEERRQFYAGAVGYFSYNGDMDMAIALRTALIKNNKIYLQAGGGVVYDSLAEAEFQETENKAMALIKAAELSKNYV